MLQTFYFPQRIPAEAANHPEICGSGAILPKTTAASGPSQLDTSPGTYYASGIDISSSVADAGLDVSGLGRFSDSALYVLASLAAGPKHGYAIMQDVQKAAGVSMGPGTLYGAIARLHRRGWIERLPASDRRHPYQLTASGRAVLLREFAELRAFADYVLQTQALR